MPKTFKIFLSGAALALAVAGCHPSNGDTGSNNANPSDVGTPGLGTGQVPSQGPMTPQVKPGSGSGY